MVVWIVNADGSGRQELDLPINVAPNGTSWSVIPDDVALPDAPISFSTAVDAL